MKTFLFFSVLLIGITTNPLTGFTQETAPAYVPLVEIPGLTTPDVTESSDLTTFWNSIYRLCIGAAVVLTIVQIIRGGLIYMTTDVVPALGDAKKIIWQSIIGLILVLSPILVLGIINPQIVGLKLEVEPVSGTGVSNSQFAPQKSASEQESTTGTTPSPFPGASEGGVVIDNIRVTTTGTLLKKATFTHIANETIRTNPLNHVISSWLDECLSGFQATKSTSQSSVAEALCGTFHSPQLFVVPNALTEGNLSTRVQVLPSSRDSVQTFRTQCAADGGVAYIPVSNPRIQIKNLTPKNAFEQLDACPAEVSEMNYPTHYRPECYRASAVCWTSSNTDLKFLIE